MNCPKFKPRLALSIFTRSFVSNYARAKIYTSARYSKRSWIMSRTFTDARTVLIYIHLCVARDHILKLKVWWNFSLAFFEKDKLILGEKTKNAHEKFFLKELLEKYIGTFDWTVRTQVLLNCKWNDSQTSVKAKLFPFNFFRHHLDGLHCVIRSLMYWKMYVYGK